jgi:hypothetical protein
MSGTRKRASDKQHNQRRATPFVPRCPRQVNVTMPSPAIAHRNLQRGMIALCHPSRVTESRATLP